MQGQALKRQVHGKKRRFFRNAPCKATKVSDACRLRNPNACRAWMPSSARPSDRNRMPTRTGSIPASRGKRLRSVCENFLSACSESSRMRPRCQPIEWNLSNGTYRMEPIEWKPCQLALLVLRSKAGQGKVHGEYAITSHERAQRFHMYSCCSIICCIISCCTPMY